MTTYRFGSRYVRWDGTQQISPLDADEIMQAISDELMRKGDLNLALRRLFWEGTERADGERVPGLRELINRVRQRRQEQLNRYDLGSIFDEVLERLKDVLATERTGIERRLEDGRERLEAARRQGGEAARDEFNGETPSPQPPAPSPDPYDEDLHRMLEQIAAKKQEQLDNLPADPAGAIKGLHDYEFMDPEARNKFQELLNMLQQQILQQSFQGMQQALGQMTPEDVGEMRQMLQDLNEMLEARQRGEDPNFEQFMHKWGHFFGPDVKSLDDLLEHMRRQMAAMQQLMESMTPEQREQLQGMMQAIMQDPGIQQEMARLGENLGQEMRQGPQRGGYRFSGDESLTLAEAMRMMDRLQQYDDLEHDLKDVRDWNDLANLDDDKVRDLLGEEEHEEMEQLRQLTKMLEEAGYITKNRRGYELTPQGVRKIGEKALTDIFHYLKKDRLGQHEVDRMGGAGERIDVTKPYEFGDPFLLDLPKTVMNAVQRGGVGSPVSLDPKDFEVYRTEFSTRSSTVLMIDMSRSMFYNDCFTAAKKVALALDSLIRSKYPRDDLSIIGFSYTAERLKPADLPMLDWNEYTYGTNMQHGFQLARQILGRSKGSNKQIIIITDGEPTAHFEDGQVFFHYPPMPRTFQETLREVIRCTRDGITINTFMLERSPYMVQFVNDLMKINNGRVFVATPDRLGEYILVDYVANKRKWIG